MTSGREIFEQGFVALKTCEPGEVSRPVMSIIEYFSFNSIDEQEEFAGKINDYAAQYIADKPLLYAYARLLKGLQLMYAGRFDECLSLLTETRKLFCQLNDPYGAAGCDGIAGTTYRTFGNVELALHSLWSSYEQVKNNDRYQILTCATGVSIALIYLEQKQYEEAIGRFKTMLATTGRPFKFYWDVYALHGLGKAYMAQKEYGEALQCFEQAITTAEKNNHQLSICNSLSELGNYYYSTGEYIQAEKYHRQALEMREQNKFKSAAVTSCISLAQVYVKLSRPNEAIQYLMKGMQIAELINVKPKIYRIHQLLSEIYEGQGDLKQALYHHKMFQVLQDEVEAEDSARKVKHVQLIFQEEQTRKENAIIKRQKEEIERKNTELQETIDELTLARVGRKARAITLGIAIVMFVLEDPIIGFALKMVPRDSYLISLVVKMVIIFSLSPINKAVEKYLLGRIIKKKKKDAAVPISSEMNRESVLQAAENKGSSEADKKGITNVAT